MFENKEHSFYISLKKPSITVILDSILNTAIVNIVIVNAYANVLKFI